MRHRKRRLRRVMGILANATSSRTTSGNYSTQPCNTDPFAAVTMLLAVKGNVWIMRAPNAPGRSFFNDPIHGRSAMLTIALHLLQSNSSFAH
jgi:hypothetical protein